MAVFLATYLAPRWRRSALLFALLIAGIALELANPQILKAFIDSAVQGAQVDRLLTIAIIFLAVALTSQLVTVAETYVAEDVGLTVTNALRADLTLHCLRLDPEFLNAHPPGELIERVDGDVSTLANFFSRFVVSLLGNGLLVVALLIVLVSLDWRIAATLAVFVALALLSMNLLRNVAVERWETARQASGDLYGFLEERLASTEDIRASGAVAYVMRRFFERTRRYVRYEVLASVLGSAAFNSALALLVLGTAAALAMGALLYQQQLISLGSVYLIFAYALVLRRPIQEMGRQMQDVQQAAAGLFRVRHLLDVPQRITDGARTLPDGALELSFDAVTFGYPGAEPVLRELSFSLSAGQVLGVLGRTGIGKTTLTRLLLRLYDVGDGAIRIGGIDVRDVQLSSLRTRVGLVTQEVQVFHGTVRDNISLFDSTVPDADMLDVLEDLGLGEWLRRSPAGLDTRLAPSGSGLSAGEAQLLAFARVFLRNPGLVILDEASSRLDPATERRIEHAVDRLLSRRTGIIIAHRLSTIGRADQVLVLDAEGIREFGPRAELSADPTSALSSLLRAGSLELLA